MTSTNYFIIEILYYDVNKDYMTINFSVSNLNNL